MGDSPNVEYDPDHRFTLNEKLFILDPNQYDVWEAIVSLVGEDYYKIHYPEWPDDDEEIPDVSKRLLIDSPRNRKIFNEQEKIRLQKEQLRNSDSEDGDFEQKKQPSKPKKTRKEKPAKEKKPKPPKEQKEKPKKERKEKPKKEKPATPDKKAQAKKEHAHEHIERNKNRIYFGDEFVQNAINQGINSEQQFIELMEQNPELQNNPKSKSNLLQQFKFRLKQDESQGIEDFDGVREYYSSDGYSTEEEAIEEIPQEEELIIPQSNKPVEKGTLIKLARWLAFNDESKPMSINFRGGKANCFLYTTDTEEYLILNGIKILLRKISDTSFSGLYSRVPVKSVGDATTDALMQQRIEVESILRPTTTYNMTDVMMQVPKEPEKPSETITQARQAFGRKGPPPKLTEEFVEDSSE